MTVVAVDDPKGMVTNADVRAEEAEVEGAIARAFAVKDRPVVVHVHTSAEQMSAWRRKGAPRVHG